MPDYQLGKIYQIVCLTTNERYIGSTTQKTLAERLSGHNRNFKQWKNGKFNFVSSYPILERGNYQIELIETFPCNSKDELNAREGFHIRNIECVNKRIAGRTDKEGMKAYREANKEAIAEKAKVYRETNKETIAKNLKATKEKRLEKAKEYYEANKETIKERNKAYKQKKKMEISK
jgi:hypothetical protein